MKSDQEGATAPQSAGEAGAAAPSIEDGGDTLMGDSLHGRADELRAAVLGAIPPVIATVNLPPGLTPLNPPAPRSRGDEVRVDSGLHELAGPPGEPPDRPTVLLDPVPARGPGDRGALSPQWAAGYEPTQNVALHSADDDAEEYEEGDDSAQARRSFVVTAATACFAILLGIIVGMLVLKLVARDEAPSLALEHAQQIERLLTEGEAHLSAGHCDDALRRADAVLLLTPDNVRARRLRDRAAACPR